MNINSLADLINGLTLQRVPNRSRIWKCRAVQEFCVQTAHCLRERITINKAIPTKAIGLPQSRNEFRLRLLTHLFRVKESSPTCDYPEWFAITSNERLYREGDDQNVWVRLDKAFICKDHALAS